MLTESELEEVKKGVEAYVKYASSYITFYKVRSNHVELSEEEKKLVPIVERALTLLGIK